MLKTTNLPNPPGEKTVAGSMRLRADLAGRHGRIKHDPDNEYAVQSYLMSALPTAEKWRDDPSQYQTVILDHLYRYLRGYLGIPVKELRKMTLDEIFEITG